MLIMIIIITVIIITIVDHQYLPFVESILKP